MTVAHEVIKEKVHQTRHRLSLFSSLLHALQLHLRLGQARYPTRDSVVVAF